MSKGKSFQSYLSKEDVMQAEIVRVLSLKYPKLFWWHTENEGNRSPFEQYKFKQMGGKAGVSDFVILEPTDFSLGLMMEIKWGKNACTKDQVDFLIESAKRGYTAAVVYDSAEDAVALVDLHLSKGVCIPSDGIMLVKGGKKTMVLFENAHKVLMKRTVEKDAAANAKKLFEKQAIKRFGKIELPKSKWNSIKKEEVVQSPK